MSETQMLAVAGIMIGSLFGLLCALIGWLGSKAIARLDSVVEMLNKVSGELHERINGLDTRLVRVETKCSYQHIDRRKDSDDHV